MSDPVSGTYRSKEEVEGKKESGDPISLFRDRLFEAGLLTQAQLEALDAEARMEVDEAARFADESPPPEADQLYKHVYHEINSHGRLFLDGRES
jgi:pyruvate dehydrogenase E1 component alpha subunit